MTVLLSVLCENGKETETILDRMKKHGGTTVTLHVWQGCSKIKNKKKKTISYIKTSTILKQHLAYTGFCPITRYYSKEENTLIHNHLKKGQ